MGSSQIPIVFENTDLHSYVVMNHGRSYTAISTIPETVGYSLLPLAPVGGIIGWMFAVEQDGFKNGFSITGNLYPTLKLMGPTVVPRGRPGNGLSGELQVCRQLRSMLLLLFVCRQGIL